MNKWYSTDDDCSQYMRNDGTTYEMIESIWLDVTEADKKKGLHEYVVVKPIVDMDNLYSEEIECYIAPYGYTLHELYEMYSEEDARDLIAECVLEEDAYSGAYTLKGFDTFEEAKTFIEDYISKN